MLPKTPTNMRQLQQRRVRKDCDGGSSMNVSRRLSRNLAREFLSSSQATESADCDKQDPDHVVEQSASDEVGASDEDELLACSYALPPVITNSCCTGRQSPDCTRSNFFPELRDR